MSEEKKVQPSTEEVNKSIKELMDKAFPHLKKAEDASKIVADADTTADAAIAKAPNSQNDKSRGGGRPKEISDVPNKDQDGARAKQYDKDITENEGEEDENEEAKKQSASIDQTSDKGHTKKNPKAPAIRPFKKGEEDFSKSYQMFLDFQDFQKIQGEAELKKSEGKVEDTERLNVIEVEPKEELQKAAVNEDVEVLRKSVESLAQSNADQLAMIKSLGAQPMPSKAVISAVALEKSVSPELKKSESFTKSQIGDAALDLAKSGKIPHDAVYELDMTGSIADSAVRRLVEQELWRDS